MRAVLFAIVVGVACGGGGEQEYTGTPGTAVPADLSAVIPYVHAGVGGGTEKLLLLDTGSPLTILDTSGFGALAVGKHDLDLATLGLTFLDVPLVAIDIPDDRLGAGVIGGDLLGLFAFTIDYQGRRVWVAGAHDPSLRPAGVDVGDEIALPAQVMGGGRYSIPGCASCGGVDVGATRFVVKAVFEGQSAPVWVIVDSGASGLVLDATFFDSLPAPSGGARPRLDGAIVGTFNGDAAGFFSRVWRVSLAGVDGVARAPIEDLPVLIVPASDLLQGLSDEIGVPAVALVGGHYLRNYLSTIDYPGRALRLAPYRDRGFIDPGEWIGVGMTFYRDGDVWRVSECFTGRDAYVKGIRPDDVVEEIDGLPLRGQPGEVLDAALARYGLGQSVPVAIRNTGGLHELMIRVEDLLPSFPPPA